MLKNSFLELQSVSYPYNEKLLLDDITFSLTRGEILSLVGQSGSGKTTLLRLIAGLETTEVGTISFCGDNMGQVSPHKRNFGMMFQEYALFPHKNVEENVSFGLEMKNISHITRQKQIAMMLELVDLSGFEKRRIDELSGGEQQRVALARSLAPEPQLLLLDEPLGSLDRGLRDRLSTDIRTILKSIGLTAIFVTHDQAEAFNIADRIGVLQNGKLIQLDVPEQLYRYPENKMAAKFLGFTNFLKGTVNPKTHVIHCALGDIRLNYGQIGRVENLTDAPPALLLIRPEGGRIEETNSCELSNRTYIQGIVTEKNFLGGMYKISIETRGLIFTFELPLDPTPPEVGGILNISIPQTSFVIIPE